MKTEIQTAELTKEAGISQINVLLVGEVAAGKSSLINTFESVFTGTVTHRAGVGQSEGSLTTQVGAHSFRVGIKCNILWS